MYGMYYFFRKHYRAHNMCPARTIDAGDIIVKMTDIPVLMGISCGDRGR